MWQADEVLFPALAPAATCLIKEVLMREFILKMQFYFVEVFLSLPEQSILKAEFTHLPEIGFYVLLDLFWTWPRHRPTPQSG